MPNRAHSPFSRQKPPPGAQIDSSHPLARGLSGLWVLNERGGSWLNLVDKTMGQKSAGSVQWVSGVDQRFSPALRHSATSDVSNLGSSSFLLPTSGCTIAVHLRKTDATLRASEAFGLAGGIVGGTECRALVPFSDGTVYWDFGGASEGTTRASIAGLAMGADFWTFTTGGRGMEIWQNGILRKSNTANATRTQGSPDFVLGAGGIAGDLTDYAYVAIWKRQLAGADVTQLFAEPFAMLRAPGRSSGKVAA